MNPSANPATSSVSPEEIHRRIELYRREGFKHQGKPQVIYHDEFVICPWTGCDYRIAAVDFRIEKLNDPALYKQVMAAWWQGPGIVARCPGCDNYVIFSVTEKRCAEQADIEQVTVLPDDWHQQAHIVN